MRAAPKQVLILATFALVTMTLSMGCGVGGGGGGGGSESSDPGTLTRFDLEHRNLDTGNFTEVRLELNNIHEGGVILKLHYSTSLAYSKSTATLFPGEDEQRFITPFIEDTNGDERYLVFFLYPDTENGNDVRLTLKLKAIAADETAYVEAGLNNNDPNIPDDEEFTVTDPLFASLKRHSVYIKGSAAEPTVAPTSTGAAAPTTAATTAPTTAATAAATAKVTATSKGTTAAKGNRVPEFHREPSTIVSAVVLPNAS